MQGEVSDTSFTPIMCDYGDDNSYKQTSVGQKIENG